MRFNLRIGRWLLHYSGRFRVYRTIPGLLGMQSRTEDGKHVLFLDFDRTHSVAIMEKIRKLQKRYSLGCFYIFRSSRGNYHAICLDKLTFGQCADIDLELGMKKYLRFAALRGFWVIRISPKREEIRYLGCIESFSINATSRAHYEFLSVLFPELVVPYNLDRSQALWTDVYTSVNK